MYVYCVFGSRSTTCRMYPQVESVGRHIREKKGSWITPTPKGMGLSSPRSGGGGAAQGHRNQSSGARSTAYMMNG